MSDTQRVIDDIDALVEEQLQQEASGYDHDINQPPLCRCGSSWHGLRRASCPGSGVEGPLVATGLNRFGTWAGEPALPPRRSSHVDPEELREVAELITATFRGIAEEVSRVWESMRRTFLGLPHPQAQAQSQSRCALAARRRMHSDQLRVRRRAVRRERRARRREAEYDHPLEVHDDHVILTLTPDVSGFRRELLEDK